MARFILVAMSRPVEGREDEYNRWYDEVHVPDVCAVPGVIGARRYDRQPMTSAEAAPYMAIYDVEADDPATVLAELSRRIGAGEIGMSDAMDRSSVTMWVYGER